MSNSAADSKSGYSCHKSCANTNWNLLPSGARGTCRGKNRPTTQESLGPHHVTPATNVSPSTGPRYDLWTIISSLGSSSESKVYNSLVQLRTKYTREKTNVKGLYDCGGIKALLKLVSRIIDEARRQITTNINSSSTDIASTSNISQQKEAVENDKITSATKGQQDTDSITQITSSSKNPIMVLATANQQPCPECLQKQLGKSLSISDGLPMEECSHNLQEAITFSRMHGKLLDLCLSILGNCVLLDDRSRNLLAKTDGIPLLAKLFILCDVDSIRNRASRTLANVLLDKKSIHLVLKEKDLISAVVKALTESDNKDCQQSYVRLLRLIGAIDAGREAVVKAEGLRPIAEKLKADHEPLVTASLRAVQDLTVRLSDGCVRQMIEADCTTFLVEAVTSSKKTFKEFSLAILLNLAPHKDFRPAFGSAGGIKCFINLAESGLKSQITLKVINVLCLCCGESVNRIKMRELGGIDLLMKCIRDASKSVLHNRIISSFVCFLYDETSFSLMLENSLMDILIEQMRRSTHVETLDLVALASEIISWEFHKEDDEFDLDDQCVEESDCPVLDVLTDTHNTKTSEVISTTAKENVNSDSLFKVSVDNVTKTEKQESDVVTVSEDKMSSESSRSDFNVADCFGMKDDCATASDELCTVDDDSTTQDAEKKVCTERVKYSIDSPSYQHTEWDYTDYYKGVKCKTSFSVDQFGGGWSPVDTDWSGYQIDSVSPQHSSACSPTYSSPRSSYSPLSNSSFASPSVSPFYGPTDTYSLPSSPDYQSSDSNQAGPRSNNSGMSIGQSNAKTLRQLSFSPVHSDESNEPAPEGSFLTNYIRDTLIDSSHIESTVPLKTSESDLSITDSQLISEAANIPPCSSDKPSSASATVKQDAMPKQCVTDSENVLAQSMDINSLACTGSSMPLILAPASVTLASESTIGENQEACQSKAMLKEETLEHSNNLRFEKNVIGENMTTNGDANQTMAVNTSPIESSLKPDKVKTERTFSHPLSVLDTSDISGESCRSEHDSAESATIVNILTLISRVSHMDDPAVYLLNTKCIDLLLSYIVVCSKVSSKAWRILIRLARIPNCFEGLLEMNVPLKVFSLLDQMRDKVTEYLKTKEVLTACSDDGMHLELPSIAKKDNQTETTKEHREKSPECSLDYSMVTVARLAEQRRHQRELTEELLQALILVAESRYGQDVMMSRFHNSLGREKQAWAVNVIYLCRNLYLQSRLLLKGGTLEFVLSKLLPEKNMMLMLLVHSVAVLGVRLRERAFERHSTFAVTSKRLLSNQCSSRPNDNETGNCADSESMQPCKRRRVMMAQCHFENSEKEENVTFILDNGCHVRANRGYLSSKSTIFAAMLEGYYAESSLGVIAISEVQSEAFVGMLHFLYGCGNETSCPCLSHSNLATNLETLRLADKYLLNDLGKYVDDQLKALVSHASVCQIAEYAAMLNCHTLLNHCLFFILFSHLPVGVRMKCIYTLMQSPHKSDITEAMKQLISKVIQD